MASESIKISFGVKQKIQPQIVKKSAIEKDEDLSDEENPLGKKRRLARFEDGVLVYPEDELDVKKKKTEAIIIPLIKELDWRVVKLKAMEKDGTISEEDKARLALLMGDAVEATSSVVDDDTEITVSKKVDNVEDADYEQVPIESFGLAILRGCGWKEGEGIGKVPQKVKAHIPQRRTKGLGLGAKPPQAELPANLNKEEAEELAGDLTNGSYVKLTKKKNAGMYGIVQAIDDDTFSAIVKLALTKQNERVSLSGLTRVTKKEYDKKSLVLNQSTYEEEAKRLEEERESYRKSKKEKKQKEAQQTEVTKPILSDSKTLWARSDLQVRFINDDYENGRYMSQKMRIVEVADYNHITLEDESGKYLYDIKQSWLETVIPRGLGAKVMIVRGSRKGEVGVVEDKDKSKEKLILRLLGANEIKRVSFDDACLWMPAPDYLSD